MKIQHGLLIVFCLILSITSKAEVLRWPQYCLNGDLQINNLKTTPLKIWLQKFKGELISETELDLKPQSQMHYNLHAVNPVERFAIVNFGGSENVAVQYVCDDKVFPAHNLEGGVLTFEKLIETPNQLWIQNLSLAPNTIRIELQNKEFKTLFTTTLSLAEARKVTYQITNRNKQWKYIKISAKERFAAFQLTATGANAPITIRPQISQVDTNASYFVVAPRSGTGDSYIAKITDPALIEIAREQILKPELEQILFAKIKKGSGGYNRNWSKLEKSFWSWSISEVTNFADVGSTSCNGLPQATEDRLTQWLTDPGRICFWNYRVKKELTPTEVAKGEAAPTPGPETR